jgi:NodT family efflux transporter outer membrane factor (OMF) lipoprotein
LKNFILHSRALVLSFALSACSITAISPGISEQGLPPTWNTDISSEQVSDAWLSEFNDDELRVQVSRAIENNYQLAEQAARVDEARQQVTVSGADRFPELSLAFDASRRRSVFFNGLTPVLGNYEFGANLNWEIDIWGKLSDAQKQASLNLLSAQASFTAAQYQLVANVSRAWFNVISASQLLNLFRERLSNLEVDRDIIERGFRQGLNNALDVYLTRATVDQERARVARQEQQLQENRVALQLLLADYPDGQFEINKTLPVIETGIPAGLPSELVERRPDLQQAWMNLLATDAGLAVAHKQRFPRLSLTASVSEASPVIVDLLSGGPLAWSLLGNLTQPLFNAGRLRALEGQARARVVQAEHQYLNQLYVAFAEVENAISRDVSLQAQYQATLEAEENAVAALTLSFEQYQRGIVTYTTVLEAQRRAFDTQSTVIDLRNQLLQNRISLYLALGGDFDTR